jgi:CheY-like chemotaxis protein
MMARIVVCEDDAQVRKVVWVALRSTPHQIWYAENGREGLALVRQHCPDVLVTDVHMPEMDGYELVRAIRADPQLARMPVVFLTASAQRYQVEEAFAHGATDFVVKPFAIGDLRAKLDQVLTDIAG